MNMIVYDNSNNEEEEEEEEEEKKKNTDFLLPKSARTVSYRICCKRH
jgi:hypothetical protein